MMTKRFAARHLIAIILAMMSLSVSALGQDSAINKLQKLGARVFFKVDDNGKKSTEIGGIEIPYDWKGTDGSLELIRDIPIGETEHRTLILLGPTTISQATIDAIGEIPTWTVERYPAVCLGVFIKPRQVSFTVSDVLSGFAADKCGITKGDVIIQVGKSKVHNLESAREALLDKKPGDEITITFTRDGVETNVVAKLSAIPVID